MRYFDLQCCFGFLVTISLQLTDSVIDSNKHKGSLQSGGSSLPSFPTTPVTFLQGSRASFPCSIKGGLVYTVLWYRDSQGEPFYTFDGRPAADKHWSAEPPAGFGARAMFVTETDPAMLVISSVKVGDAGLFRCRVDFKANQTQNIYVQASVIVPPQKPIISTEPSHIKAFEEGGVLKIMCIVKSGIPTPNVYWTLNKSETLLTSLSKTNCPNRPNTPIISTSMSVTPPSLVVARLESRCLPRSLAGVALGCVATNNNISSPVRSGIVLHMMVGPSLVTITTEQWPFSSDRPYNIKCSTFGSIPPATLTWWKGGKLMGLIEQMISEDENATTSELQIIPKYHDNGKNLTCRAENTNLLNNGKAAKESNLNLNVLYPPRVVLSYGASIDRHNIIEGSDVYFECKIEANPNVYKVEWNKNNTRVEQNLPQGVVVSNSALVLQKVDPNSSGSYSCTASNIEGDTLSNSQHLQVKYKPRCVHLSPLTVAVSESSTNLIPCDSEGVPQATTFRWVLNASGIEETLRQKKSSLRLLKSQIRISDEEKDVGIVECWASNNVGEAEEPCTFQLVAAGLPGPPEDCRVTKETNDSLTVVCLLGWSGGLKQTFHLELWDGKEKELLRNVTDERRPRFELDSLQAGKRLIIKIYSANKKGRSAKIVELESSTSKVAELQIETAPAPVGQTVLGLVAGTAVTVLLLVCTIAVLIMQKLSRNSIQTQPETVACPGTRGEEYLQMERQTVVPDRTETGAGGTSRTEVSYQGTETENMTSDSYSVKYNARDTFTGGTRIGDSQLSAGGEQATNAGTDYGVSPGLDPGLTHGKDYSVSHQRTNRDMIHGTDYETDPVSMIVEECDDGWSEFGHRDTRILLPMRQGYTSQPRTNIKLNPIFE